MDWATRLVTIPQADLTLVSGSKYEYDVNALRLGLKTLEASPVGLVFPDTHAHNTSVDFGGLTKPRVVIMINNFTIEFEDGPYTVTLIGADHNIPDVTVENQVSIRSVLSTGTVETASGAVDLSQVLAELATILTRINADEVLTAGVWQALEAGTTNVLSEKTFAQNCDDGSMSLTE
jgi:hypothetical protein